MDHPIVHESADRQCQRKPDGHPARSGPRPPTVGCDAGRSEFDDPDGPDRGGSTARPAGHAEGFALDPTPRRHSRCSRPPPGIPTRLAFSELSWGQPPGRPTTDPARDIPDATEPWSGRVRSCPHRDTAGTPNGDMHASEAVPGVHRQPPAPASDGRCRAMAHAGRRGSDSLCRSWPENEIPPGRCDTGDGATPARRERTAFEERLPWTQGGSCQGVGVVMDSPSPSA